MLNWDRNERDLLEETPLTDKGRNGLKQRVSFALDLSFLFLPFMHVG